MNLKLIFIFTGLLCFSTAPMADPILPGPLIKAEWLAENIDYVKILDVRKNIDDFLGEGHIDGAVLVSASKMRVTRTIDGRQVTRLIPERGEFEKFMESHGVSNGDTVIITHEGNTPGDVAGAARLYWQLKVYGFSQVAIFDGGNRAWVSALEDLTTEAVNVKYGSFRTSGSDSSILATTKDVEAALRDKAITLIDTRPLRFHIGLSQKDYVFAPGHIPNSRNFPYKFLTATKGDMSFLPIDRIKNVFKNLAIDPTSPSILYCNSAYECASVWLVMHEMMGNKKVRIYDGALHEWTMDEKHPMTTIVGQ